RTRRLAIAPQPAALRGRLPFVAALQELPECTEGKASTRVRWVWSSRDRGARSVRCRSAASFTRSESARGGSLIFSTLLSTDLSTSTPHNLRKSCYFSP